MENRKLQWTLGISLILHVLLVFGLSRASREGGAGVRPDPAAMEVTYYAPDSRRATSGPKKGFRPLQEEEPGPKIGKLKFFIKELPSAVDTELKQEMSPASKNWTSTVRGNKAAAPVFKTGTVFGNEYTSYRAVVRQKIKRRIHYYKNHPGIQMGEVYVSFVLNNKGNLQAIRVVDDRTTATVLEKEIALRSVRESSPFPPFPEDLHFGELTFGIPISYETRSRM